MRTPVFALILIMLTACGGAVLPRFGEALQRIKDSYGAAEQAREKVTVVQALICAEPELQPRIASMCSDTDAALAEASRASRVAHDAINAARDVYTAVNDGMDDAGVP